MEIHKKTWPEYFEIILSGEKTFEYRLADFECKPGDTLILEEWDPKTKTYTGRNLTKTAGYILSSKDIPDFHADEKTNKNGFMIISLKD